ncbi:MAG: endonuclease/exonuclease/phosphatase family protein [Prevotella sp.]|nr:endonuclease/exonuclease/phosphatase family protein [Prevotella sp.]
MANKTIKILTLNIGNPSINRAKSLIEWLKKRDEDILLLTETKNSDGCKLIEKYFLQGEQNLFDSYETKEVFFPKPIDNNYGVMCISKYNIVPQTFLFEEKKHLCSRVANLQIDIDGFILNLMGLYVPSRDQSIEKIERKSFFLKTIGNNLRTYKKEHSILCGDFNIIDRKHIPKYNVFYDWEYNFYDNLISLGYIDTFKYCNPNKQDYSWIGRTNNGYRYDYFFVSNDLKENIISCHFEHNTRYLKLSDHSAVVLEISI